MHDFLRAVGFKNIKDQKELDELLQSIVSSPTNYMSARDSEGNEYAEFCLSWNVKNILGKFSV